MQGFNFKERFLEIFNDVAETLFHRLVAALEEVREGFFGFSAQWTFVIFKLIVHLASFAHREPVIGNSHSEMVSVWWKFR